MDYKLVLSHFIHNHKELLRSSCDLIQSLRAYTGRRCVVVFLVHHLQAWSAISPIWKSMVGDDFFVPIVISIPHRFGKQAFDGEELVHNFLVNSRVPHLRFNFTIHEEGLALLQSLRPTIIVRQSYWDDDIPPAYSVENLNFSRLLYTDYALTMLKHRGFDSALHRRAWMILCANSDQYRCYREENPQLDRIFVTGYPKLDALCKALKTAYWPLQSGATTYKILWCPHHTVKETYLSFGTFDYVCEDMLKWVACNKNIQVVLRPHPMLFEKNKDPELQSLMDNFIKEWNNLPNTAVSLNDNYAHLFAASDCLVTDGVSFLAEYPLTEKPIIYIENPNHEPFNRIGSRCVATSYRVHGARSIERIVAILQKEKEKGQNDALFNKRKQLKHYLMPYAGVASKRVIACIKKELALEADGSY